MDLKKWLLGAAGALALGSIALAAEAAPAIGPAAGHKAVADENSAVQDVHWRWRRHYRPYYYVPEHYYYRPYYYHKPHHYRWYRGDYSYGPGFGFYFGPRHHRHWW